MTNTPPGLRRRNTSSKRSADLENVLERLDAKDSAGRCVGKVDRRHVLDPVDARPGPHVAADVFSPRKEAAKVREAFLAIDLVGTELEDRDQGSRLSRPPGCKVPCCGCASPGLLLEPGWGGRAKRSAATRRPHRPSRLLGLGRIIDRPAKSVKANEASSRDPAGHDACFERWPDCSSRTQFRRLSQCEA